MCDSVCVAIPLCVILVALPLCVLLVALPLCVLLVALPLCTHVLWCALTSSHTVCVVCRLETANLRLQGELERAPGWEEVHRCTHTHTHAHIPAHTHISYIIFATVPGEIQYVHMTLCCCHANLIVEMQPSKPLSWSWPLPPNRRGWTS